MTTQFVSAPASNSVHEVMKQMLAEDVGRVVLTENDVPVGIFTERHVLRRVANRELDLKNASVDELMTSPVQAISEDTHIVDALTEMFRGRIRHLLVHGFQGKIVGLVSMRRILALAVELGQGASDSTSVASIMNSDAVVVDETVSVADTIERMTDAECGAAVVLAGKRPLGIFTERDVLNRVIGMDLAPKHTLIKEVMTCPLFSMAGDAAVAEVLTEMYRPDVRNMPIVSVEGEFIGLVSMPEVLHYAKALDIDDSVRQTWKQLEKERGDDFTPG